MEFLSLSQSMVLTFITESWIPESSRIRSSASLKIVTFLEPGINWLAFLTITLSCSEHLMGWSIYLGTKLMPIPISCKCILTQFQIECSSCGQSMANSFYRFSFFYCMCLAWNLQKKWKKRSKITLFPTYSIFHRSGPFVALCNFSIIFWRVSWSI